MSEYNQPMYIPLLREEYQELVREGCPYCGEALVIKHGRYGEFLACSEWCGFTKSIRGRSEYPLPKTVRIECPYKKCDGKGLIPFVKDERVIPFAWLYCDCHTIQGINPEPERYRDIRPEDYDYPLSETFRAWTFEHCGVPDPGYSPQLKERIRLEVEPVEPEPLKHSEFIQLRSEMNFVRNTMNKHIDKAKKFTRSKQTVDKNDKFKGFEL